VITFPGLILLVLLVWGYQVKAATWFGGLPLYKRECVKLGLDGFKYRGKKTVKNLSNKLKALFERSR